MSILNTPRAGIFERLGSAGKPSKKTKANRTSEARRIETLGQMWDRRKAANGARDKAALMVLASEYASLGCPNTAQQVMSEAEAIHGQNK